MRRKASKRVTNRWMILSLIVLAVVLSGAIYTYSTMQTSSEENVIETSTIDTGDIILSATGLGTLIPSEEVSFGFKNGGEVSEVLVSLGEQVEAGQGLARLKSGTLALKYKQAEASLAALRSPAEIASAKRAVLDAKESLATARDDLQFMIGPEMMVAEEQVVNAQKALDAAKAAAEKDPSDANKKNVSETEVALADAEETLTYAYYNYSNSYTLQTFTYPIRNDQGTTIRRELIAPTDAELLAARAAYELAQANLEDAQNYQDILTGVETTEDIPASSVTSLTEAKFVLDSAKADLDATELIAPVGGIITSISLNAGEEVGTSSVVTISNLNQPYTLEVYLDETDWGKAKVGFDATVTFDLLPDDIYSAKVTQVYPMLDDSSGTSMVRVLVQLDQAIGVDLPAGSTASVDVVGGEVLNAVLVPASALKEVEAGNYLVYLMKNGGPVEQEVELGLQDLLYAEVKSGLETGDVVLTDARQAAVAP
ncbi:MAG TPA: efflux RND transporter periplasmic adaptor subunit [Anaerolineales bacterium]|nr:efflux RND transporter periplasmic adaptor subunit [Anaerolineales bacterium]